MKISKLFHWLYAIVMLLPIFAIGSTCLISTFNQESKYESTPIYEYKTNSVQSVQELVKGNIYSLKTTDLPLYVTSYNDLIGVEKVFINGLQFNFDYEYANQYNLRLSYNPNTNLLAIQLLENTTWVKTITNININDISTLDFTFNYSINQTSLILPIISESTLNFIIGIDTHYVDGTTIFYRSIDKVVESPLFNWAYNSFLVTPFSYIANLFSMPVNSPIVMFLSYWLAISVIWLVFDLIMYVPLLVHSWIDRGMVK